MTTSITNNQYQKLKSIIDLKSHWHIKDFEREEDDFPVTHLSADRVDEFIEALNSYSLKHGVNGKFDLPDDTEWEFVAKRNEPRDFKENRNLYSNFSETSWNNSVLPVRAKRAGLLQVHMYGNVCEWTRKPSFNLERRNCRGGSFRNTAFMQVEEFDIQGVSYFKLVETVGRASSCEKPSFTL